MNGRGTCWLCLWLALLGAAFLALFGMFGPHPLSLPSLQEALQARVQTVLAEEGFGLSVDMDGQTARLEGAVPSELERERARQVVATAAGPGTMYIGGVTKVDMSNVVIGRLASPFAWAATVTPGSDSSTGSVQLSGHVPSARAHKALMDAARERFRPREVIDSMTYAVGAPQGDWIKTASDSLAQLALLKYGELRLEDTRLSLLGEGDQASVARVEAYYAQSPNPVLPPFTLVSLDLNVEGQGIGIPELQGMTLAQPEAEDCQTAFTVIMRRNEINFMTGSADIDPTSRMLLDNLAKVARRCDRFQIQISGHTDDVGDPGMNLALSQRRAESVRGYLVSRGVASNRLAARGYGETAPAFPNTTEANRARNRRIVFEVS